MTVRCAKYIAEQSRIRTFADIARTVGIDEKTVRQIAAEEDALTLQGRIVSAPTVLGTTS